MSKSSRAAAEGTGPDEMLAAIQRTTVSDAVITRFKHLISTGELKPGDRLPGELVLARRLGVSRASVREALKGVDRPAARHPHHGRHVRDERAVPAAFLRAVLDYHLAVAGAAQNPVLSQLPATLLAGVERTIPDAATVPFMPQAALHHHRLLLEAIAAGDPDAAHNVVRQYLRRVEEMLMRRLTPRETVPPGARSTNQ